MIQRFNVMKSPFPGMDPYLESPEFWPDFHSRFVNAWCEAVADVLPDDYEASLDERVVLVEAPPPAWESGTGKHVLPDIAISQRGATTATGFAATSTSHLEPVTIPLVIDLEATEIYIKILHGPDRLLVTVIELLSPSNKFEVDYGDYHSKRSSLLRQRVNLVELDLLIGGRRVQTARPLPEGDYYAFVARGNRYPNADVYAWTIRDRLPTIRIPLKAPDEDLSIDLAPVFETAYARGRYSRRSRYGSVPGIRRSEEVLKWCAELAQRQ
jgi:hypothetical protein